MGTRRHLAVDGPTHLYRTNAANVPTTGDVVAGRGLHATNAVPGSRLSSTPRTAGAFGRTTSRSPGLRRTTVALPAVRDFPGRVDAHRALGCPAAGFDLRDSGRR
jgi:hypothetical protein